MATNAQGQVPNPAVILPAGTLVTIAPEDEEQVVDLSKGSCEEDTAGRQFAFAQGEVKEEPLQVTDVRCVADEALPDEHQGQLSGPQWPAQSVNAFFEASEQPNSVPTVVPTAVVDISPIKPDKTVTNLPKPGEEGEADEQLVTEEDPDYNDLVGGGAVNILSTLYAYVDDGTRDSLPDITTKTHVPFQPFLAPKEEAKDTEESANDGGETKRPVTEKGDIAMEDTAGPEEDGHSAKPTRRKVKKNAVSSEEDSDSGEPSPKKGKKTLGLPKTKVTKEKGKPKAASKSSKAAPKTKKKKR